MNVSKRWLEDMVTGLDLPVDELCEVLALAGAPVDDVSQPGAELSDIVVGKVVSAQQHPNADRLSLCVVDGGDGDVQVVCGAPNVKAGAWYPYAPVGSVLPGDFKLKKAKIRGEVSNGMLCSAKELGLGVEHDGILEIEGDFTPGQSFVEAMGLDDVTLDVEVTANRGDLMSHIGVARELSAAGAGGVITLPEIPDAPPVELTYEEGSPSVEVGGIRVQIDEPELCTRYLGAVIRGVKIGPSPAWLQERLRGAGARPINNIVDATNYVMLELGQPMHAFDLNRLAGPAIVVRKPAKKEAKFTTLDGQEREVGADMLMICDAERPVAIAGVMGGLDSEVEDDTTDVLLECALFETKSTRRTRKELVMSTDASYRYERGVDPDGLRRAVERCVSIMLAVAGGEVDGPVLDCCPDRFEPFKVDLRKSRVHHLLGVELNADQINDLIAPLGFESVGYDGEDVSTYKIPGHRSYDVTREVDLIEEVARTYGFDNFPDDLGPYRPGTVPDNPIFQLEDDLRRALAGRGLFEAQTPAFAPAGEGDVEVANPLTTTEPFMRAALLPGLLRRVEYNFAHGNRDVRLFELGTVFRNAGAGEPPHEETRLAVAVSGRSRPPHWSSDDVYFDLWDLKALMTDTAAEVAGAPVAIGIASDPAGRFDPAQCFSATSATGESLGWGGRVASGVVDAPAWAKDVWAFELTLPSDVSERETVTYDPLPQFPASERDLALIVPDGVLADQLERCIRNAGARDLESVELFDLYEGEGVADGQRSLAFRLRFRSSKKTLRDKDVDKGVNAILKRLSEELGVEARG